MSEEIVPNGVASLGERGIAASFAALLSVTTDAVLIFDGNGLVLLANEEASRVFGTRSEGLVGTDVRLLFVPAATVDACEGPVTESLPFALDGSTTSISLPAGGTSSGVLFVRCMPLRLSFAAYLLVAHCGGGETGDGERDCLRSSHAPTGGSLARCASFWVRWTRWTWERSSAACLRR